MALCGAGAQQAVSPAHNLILATMDDSEESGTCGEFLEWYFKDGVLVVTGTGRMNGYLNAANGAPWYGLRKQIGSVIIDEGVTGIGSGAFKDCYNMAEIVLPTSLIGIEEEVFSGCSNLVELTLPDSMTGIGDYAFQDCSSLTEVVIPNGVTYIGEGAFSRCISLTELELPDGLTNIGYYAFNQCDGLTELIIPDSVTSIGYRAFRYCEGLKEVTIPDSITVFEEEAFYGCSSLEQVILLGSQHTKTYLDYFGYIFENCSDMMTVYYEDSAMETYINSNTDLWNRQNITWILK